MYWTILIYMFFGWSVGVVFQWNSLAAMFDVFFFCTCSGVDYDYSELKPI